jgi:tetratricopeptide (TPR) repeat protein
MPNENQIDPRKQLTPRVLPWALGAAMFIIYLLTLNRWVTLANILPVAKASGFLWQPELYNPLQFLVLLPFRLLPAAIVPLALNLFSAACAAVTLGLLARSVAILPRDRTGEQRARERSDFAFLTTRSAWFPPLLAVALLGWQFGFWQNATNFTGESLNVLLGAVVVWLLLEYRLDERPGRLTLAAFLYGAGMAENWALLGFLPVFITAIIWLKGWEFFNLRFLSRMTWSGLGGLLALLLLLPVVGMISGNVSMSFWEWLKPALKMDWTIIHAVTVSDVRHNLLLMSLTTLLPVLLMAIRWSATLGDSSRTGMALANQMFHLIHAVIFGVCLWIMLDPPFSPGQLAMGSPALTFYYLAALAIGYYCGYFLLVFGKKIPPSRRNPRPDPALPGALQIFVPVIHWGTYAVATLIAIAVVYKNLPLIRASNDDTLKRYAELTAESLPPEGGILLSDSEGVSGQQLRGLLIQAELARTKRAQDFLVVDTQSLNWAPYLRFLHRQNPKLWPKIVGEKDMGGVNPVGLMGTLNLLAKSNNVCYLNPSFGYYFEIFYLEPHGLVYRLKSLPEDTLLPPTVTTNLIAENQNFWQRVVENEFPRLEKAQLPYQPRKHPNPINWLIGRLHGQAEPNPNTLFAANLYARALDFWGVQLQRADRLPAAADCFAQAKAVNPDNVVAAINLNFNQSLQAGQTPVLDLSRANPDTFGKYRDWNSLLNANGPFDEPSFCFQNGLICMANTFHDQPMPLMRQALAEFVRVRHFLPDNLVARLKIAQLYLFNRLPDPALEALHDPLTNPARFGLNETNSIDLNVLASAAYFQKNEISRGSELLELELSRHPQDDSLTTSAAQAYFLHGLYTNALRVIDRRLAQSPDDAKWLFGKGYANLQLKHYDQAIAIFTRVLQVATNDPTARFNRALAYLDSGRLDDARADYAALQTTYTNSFQVAFGLAEVAWRQHNTNEAIRNYELYLANAPTNSAESKTVGERLKALKR